jgi:hypothetical protein
MISTITGRWLYEALGKAGGGRSLYSQTWDDINPVHRARWVRLAAKVRRTASKDFIGRPARSRPRKGR